MKDKNNEEEQLKSPLAGSRRTKARGRIAEMSIMRVMTDKSKEEEQLKCPSSEI
ncbi:MAG TPA: hypothetical protein VNM69_03705 [Bacillus sp. (in: firmicutes)]|nr:hypothetical protein [Bacillus sp. (in: firmicutes)]